MRKQEKFDYLIAKGYFNNCYNLSVHLTTKWFRHQLRYGTGNYAKSCSEFNARNIVHFIKKNNLNYKEVLNYLVNYLESRERNTILPKDLIKLQEHFNIRDFFEKIKEVDE